MGIAKAMNQTGDLRAGYAEVKVEMNNRLTFQVENRNGACATEVALLDSRVKIAAKERKT